MVENKFINTIIKRLEKYLIKKNNFHLMGDNYDLILLVPSYKYSSENKYSLIISSKLLNTYNQKDIIIELLSDFKEVLSFDEYNAISRLNIIHSEDSFVKNLKNNFIFSENIIEINNIIVGGVTIEFAYLLKSLLLDKLIDGKALKLDIEVDNKNETINAGIIRIEKNFDVVFYTGKGLHDIFKPNMTEAEKNISNSLKKQTEDFLISNNYISKIKIDNIIK